jgi:hypothetical protein
MHSDESPDLQRARSEGYHRGLAVGLFWTASFCAVYAAAWPPLEIPRFISIFERVKVPMPGMTIMAIAAHKLMSVALLIGIGVCAAACYRRHVKAWLWSGALMVLALFWATFCTLAMKLPFLAIVDGIGRGRP